MNYLKALILFIMTIDKLHLPIQVDIWKYVNDQ